MKNRSPVKAIRTKCLECSAGQIKEVRDCVITDCALYPFRMGKNPNRQGIGLGRVPTIEKHEPFLNKFSKSRLSGSLISTIIDRR